jgi:hypothetical protein
MQGVHKVYQMLASVDARGKRRITCARVARLMKGRGCPISRQMIHQISVGAKRPYPDVAKVLSSVCRSLGWDISRDYLLDFPVSIEKRSPRLMPIGRRPITGRRLIAGARSRKSQ